MGAMERHKSHERIMVLLYFLSDIEFHHTVSVFFIFVGFDSFEWSLNFQFVVFIHIAFVFSVFIFGLFLCCFCFVGSECQVESTVSPTKSADRRTARGNGEGCCLVAFLR